MRVANSFTGDGSIEQVWVILTDIEQLALCLPGAKLTGEQDGVFSGGLTIKMGPVTAEYQGRATFVERDEAKYRAVLDSKGRDARGAGNVQALITAQLAEVGDKTKVDISTDLNVTGRVAQFGGGVMQEVSEKFVSQFAGCVAAKVADSPAASAGASESSTAAGTAQRSGTQDHAVADASEDQELDLLDVAGGPVFKRLIPAACLALIVVVVLLILL